MYLTGSSSWIDFLNPSIRQWWAEQFSPDKYQVSVLVKYLSLYFVVRLMIFFPLL